MTDNFRFSFNRFGVGGPNDTVTLLGVKYSNVTTITIPNTYGQTPIANIAEDAFADMPNLIKVDMDVKMLRFYECFRDYPTIYQDLRSQYRAWAKKHKVEPSNLPKYATDYSDLFSNSQQLSHLNIPNEVKNITRAFEGSSISSVFIPKTVEEMEASLKNCEKLKMLVIEGNYTKGDLFGEQESNVEKVISCQKSPVIVGSTPEATWYVPNESIPSYEQAFKDKNIRYKEILPLCTIEDVQPMFKSYVEEDKNLSIMQDIQFQFNQWQITQFSPNGNFVIFDTNTGKEALPYEKTLNMIMNLSGYSNWGHEDWDQRAIVSNLIDYLIDKYAKYPSMYRLFFNPENVKEPGASCKDR